MKNSLKIESNLLVSFRSIDEISRECLRYVDIVDLKNPDLGAIGSWKIKDIKKVIEDFGSKHLISATIGDEKNIKNVVKKLLTYDQLNLDFIKFGIFANNKKDLLNLLKNIPVKLTSSELVPIVFVENIFLRNFILENLKQINELGFKFILFDTYFKNEKDLLDNWEFKYFEKLMKSSKNLIFVGLAGKLSLKKIPNLINLHPKIIGVRSAVCKSSYRGNKLSINKVKEINYLIKSSRRLAIHSAGA